MLILGRLGLPPKWCESSDLHDERCFPNREVQKWLGRSEKVEIGHLDLLMDPGKLWFDSGLRTSREKQIYITTPATFETSWNVLRVQMRLMHLMRLMRLSSRKSKVGPQSNGAALQRRRWVTQPSCRDQKASQHFLILLSRGNHFEHFWTICVKMFRDVLSKELKDLDRKPGFTFFSFFKLMLDTPQ